MLGEIEEEREGEEGWLKQVETSLSGALGVNRVHLI